MNVNASAWEGKRTRKQFESPPGSVCLGSGVPQSFSCALFGERVAEVQREAGVGRATFYRLFDNMSDVLYYQCERLGKQVLSTWRKREASRDSTFLRFAMCFWTEHASFLEALFKSGRSDILERAIKEHVLCPDGPAPLRGLDEEQRAYAVAMMSAMLSGALMTYIARGKRETPDELYETLLASMGGILTYLAEK